MLDRPQLPARQQQWLDRIQSAIARTGAPPTRAEIATELGFKSANAAEEHLQALARKGVIELVSGTSRGIRLKGRSRSASRRDADPVSLSMPGLGQPSLPLVGRLPAACPILAQGPVDRPYHCASTRFRPMTDLPVAGR